MKTFYKCALVVLAGVVVGLGAGFAFQTLTQHAPTAGAFNPTGGGTYYLQASISSSQNTITLTSFTEPVSNIPYTMAYLNSDIMYGTIAPQTDTSEFISFTGINQNSNGTATLTGVVRGLGRSYPYAASTTLANPYPGQTRFILSSPPEFFNEYAARRNAQSITGLWTFSSTSRPTYDGTPASYNSFDLVDYQTLVNTAISGAGTSTFSNMGIVQLATNVQVAAGTASTTEGRPLVLLSKFATTTPGVQCNTSIWSCIVVAGTNGHIAQTWLDLTQSFAPSGLWVFSNKVGIGTTSPYAALSVVDPNPAVFGTIFATSTSVNNATSTFAGNISVGTNATTTNLYVGGFASVGIIATTSLAATGPTVNTAAASQTVTCPTGYSVLGGGTQVTGIATIVLTENYPPNTTSWKGTVVCTNGGGCGANTITITAICARLK